MHETRKAFVHCESSQKLKRASCHKLRTFNGTRFIKGYAVYHKRNSNVRRQGPGKAFVQDGQILIKHRTICAM